MAEPSIAMIPSGYKANKVYSVLPSNGDGDFDFTRGSTATRVNQNGLIEEVAIGVPRLDYEGGGCPSLLLEPASTNLVTYSEDFSQSVWGTWQSTKTLSNNINPKGTNGYYEISHTGSSSDNPNTRLTNVSLNGSYTLSFFVKINQSRYISLSIEDYDGDRAKVYFDTINKTFTTISNVGSPITNTSYSEFSNGWIRISLSVNLLNAVYNEVGIGIYNLSSSFPSASGEVISVFGCQLEQQSYATSYIKTEGSTQTRLADTAYKSGLENEINSEEGVLFVEISALSNDLTNRFIIVNDNTNNNRLTFRYRTTSNQLSMEVHIGGVLKFTILTTITDITVTQKVALKFKQNDYALWVNGTEVGLNTLSEIWNTNTLSNIVLYGFGQSFYGKVKQLQVFKTALTDAQLTTLTTI